MEALTEDSPKAPIRIGYSFALTDLWQAVDRERLAEETQNGVAGFGSVAIPENGLPLTTGKRANLFFVNGEPGPRQGNAVAVMVGDENDFRNPPRSNDGAPGPELLRLHSGCLFSLAGVALTETLFDLASVGSTAATALETSLASGKYSYIRSINEDSFSAGLVEEMAASNDCDCRAQGKDALDEIYAKGGLLFDLMEQEARGHGLKKKLDIYAQQEMGYTSAQACTNLGLSFDVRDYSAAAAAMIEWTDERPDINRNFREVTLMTNNPRKHQGLRAWGINTNPRPHVRGVTDENIDYLIGKAREGGHTLSVEELRILVTQSNNC